MTPNERACDNLRRALLYRRFEVVDLARRASAADPGHSGIRMTRRHLCGATRMGLDVIALYARILRVTPEWLAFGDGPPVTR